MYMLAEILSMSVFMGYIVLCILITCSIIDRLTARSPKRIERGYTFFIAFVIAYTIWIITCNYVHTYMEKVAKFMLGV